MAETPWATLTVWPWQDAYLRDAELFQLFEEHDLAEVAPTIAREEAYERTLKAPRDGEVSLDADDNVVITGRMGDLTDSALLTGLRSRGIAYAHSGDDEDADSWELFWHPGMDEPFFAWAIGGERVLTAEHYREMLLASKPLHERIDAVGAKLRREVELLDAVEKTGQVSYEVVIGRNNVEKLTKELTRLALERPAPVPLEQSIATFMETSSKWTPPDGYEPALQIAAAEAVA